MSDRGHRSSPRGQQRNAAARLALLYVCFTAFVTTTDATLSPTEGGALRLLTITLATTLTLLLTTTATAKTTGTPRPALITRISKHVFGARWRVAACIAHYESTDGAYLSNWPNEGPWQVSVTAHPWVDRRRVVSDWWYSARVAYRLSNGGTDWSAWSTEGSCV